MKEQAQKVLQALDAGQIEESEARDLLSGLKAKQESKPQVEEPGLGMQALDYGGRALDYAGGLARTTAGQVADTFTEDNNITSTDFMDALKGKAPSTEEMMGRFDIPEGSSVNLPFIGQTSVRDVAGFAGDVALDPLTYLSLGALPALKYGGKAAKAATALSKPTAKLTSGAGKALYKSGFKKIDEKVAEKGKKKLFSDLMLEHGVTGTNKTVQKKAAKIADNLLEKRTNIFNKLDADGVTVDMENIFSGVMKSNDELAKVPGMKKMASKMDDAVLDLMDEGNVSVSNLSKAKTLFYDSLPANAFSANGTLKSSYQKFEKKVANSMKTAIEEAAEKSQKGLGKKVAGINEDLGSLLTARKPMAVEVGKANTKNAVTSVDSALAFASPGTLAAKKAGDIGKTTVFRTKTGKALKGLGDSGAGDILLRSAITDRQDPTKKINPWR